MRDRINAMYCEYGFFYAHPATCKECSNLLRTHAADGSRTLKCMIYGNTNSKESDWDELYLACGMFNRTLREAARVAGQYALDDLAMPGV